MDRGRIAGEAAQRSGQIWGGLAQNLGQLGSSALSSMLQYKQDAPRREMEALQLQQAKRDMAAQDRQAQDARTMQSAMSSRLDPAHIESQLAQLGQGHLIPAFKKSWMDSETAKLTLRTKRSEVEAAEADYFGALASGVKAFQYDPGAVRMAFQKAKEDGYDDADGMLQQIEQNPQSIQALVDSLIQKSPTQRKLAMEESDRALKQQQEQRAGMESMERVAAQNRDDQRGDRQLSATIEHNRAMETIARQRPTSDDPGPLETVIGPDGKAIRVARKDAVGKPPAAGTEKASSGQQKRVLNFFNRAQQADVDLEGMEPEIQNMGLAGQTWQAVMPNFLQTDVGQRYTAAQRAFTEARLRKDSGAAIPEQEFANDRKTYFVQPGDSKETLEQKRRARGAMLASLAFESGQALGEYVGDANEARKIVDGYKARAAKPDGEGSFAVQAPNGKTYTFKSQKALDEFKLATGMR